MISLDFFKAVDLLQADISKAEKKNEKLDFKKINHVMKQGLRHFLVRTTRRGIADYGSDLVGSDGKKQSFPQTRVSSSAYTFSDGLSQEIKQMLSKHKKVFGNIDPQVS